MITIISGTNRPGNQTYRLAKQVAVLLEAKTDETVNLVSLCQLPHDWYHEAMYSGDKIADSLKIVQDKYIYPADKFIYLSPEYNGSIAGALKLFIDAISVRSYPKNFMGKKAGIIGVASGRAGNLRGIDHLTGVLHHVGTTVMPKGLPVSQIGSVMDEEGKIINEGALEALDNFLNSLLAF